MLSYATMNIQKDIAFFWTVSFREVRTLQEHIFSGCQIIGNARYDYRMTAF